jgi:PASTA domain
LADEAAREEAREGPRAVPNETGVRLDVAEKDLKEKRVSYKVVGAVASGPVVKSDWTVCETNPKPHTHLSFGTTVTLIVASPCK